MGCKVLVDTKSISNNEWLDYRRQGIGGSDVGAILGFNKYKSAYMVYLEKLGPYQQDLSDKECVYWGNALEDIVAKEFTRRTGKKVRKRNAVLQSKTYPFMLANVDREIIGENALLECKTTNAYLGADWDGEEIPATYILQCQHYMAVTGADKTYIACLIGGNKFIWKEITRDEELIIYLVEQEKSFWEKVQSETPPEIGGSEGEKEYINCKYPDSNQEQIDLSNEMVVILDEYKELFEMSKNIEIKLEQCKNQVKEYMKDNEIATSERHLVRWKSTSTNRLDTTKLKSEQQEIYNKYLKTTTSRSFECKENK